MVPTWATQVGEPDPRLRDGRRRRVGRAQRGNEYRFYNSHAAVPVEQKLFRRVAVADATTRPQETLALLSKAQMADHLIDELWKAHFIDRQIRYTLEGLFGTEPDPSLVRLIRSRIPALSPAEIRAELGRLRVTFDFPDVPHRPAAASAVVTGDVVGPGPSAGAGCDAPRGEDHPASPPSELSIYLLSPVRSVPEATARECLESLLGQSNYILATDRQDATRSGRATGSASTGPG